MPTDTELRPYGFARGHSQGWCAACNRTVENMDQGAFKCRPCAVEQFREVGRLCRKAGIEE